jgi:hypothetical protein
MRQYLTLLFAAAIMMPCAYYLFILYLHALESLRAIVH